MLGNAYRANRRLTGLCAALICMAGGTLLGGAAGLHTAGAQGNEKAVDTYCSPTGDYCTEITRQGSKFFFKLVTFAHRGKAKFCVRPKGGRKTCNKAKLRDDGDDVFLARINWNRNYPSKGKARRKVTIFARDGRLGPALRFKP